MKRIYLGLAASVFLAVSSFPSYAGQWKQDTTGWKYESDDHTFLQDQWFRDDDGKWYYFEPDGLKIFPVKDRERLPEMSGS